MTFGCPKFTVMAQSFLYDGNGFTYLVFCDKKLPCRIPPESLKPEKPQLYDYE